ncbi:MAG TPA: spondin domain-containing protein [Actinomycetota bacterium]|nr:spondin domain-containing protein [Actinomycetota bacterium]
MRRTLSISLAAMLLALIAGAALPAGAQSARPSSFRVTITNLAEGQPLTPPVVALHNANVDIFTVGEAASFEVKEIAENGNNAPLLGVLGSLNAVADFAEGTTGPLVPPGTPGDAMFDQSVEFELAPEPGSRFLSVVSMLICTNDGFSGVDSIHVPKAVGETVTHLANAYEAGTEANTEDLRDMVPPCQDLMGVTGGPGTGQSDPALAQNSVIQHHSGITGRRDLIPEVHGWTDPVMRIEIEALP